MSASPSTGTSVGTSGGASASLGMEARARSDALLAGLFQQAERDPVFRHVSERLTGADAKGRFNVGGMGEVQLAFWLAALQAKTGRPIFFVAADELRLRSVEEALNGLRRSEQFCSVIRRGERALTAMDRRSREMEQLRQLELNAWCYGDTAFLLTSAVSLMEKLRPHEAVIRNRVDLNLGDRAPMEEIEARLLACGYERTARAEHVGEFARRGDILDFVPPLAAWERSAPYTPKQKPGEARQDADVVPTALRAWRISFFDDEIDAVRVMNAETQRSLQEARQLRIEPILELTGMDFQIEDLARRVREEASRSVLALRRKAVDSEILRRLEADLNRDLANMDAGNPSAVYDRWFPLIYPDAENLLDYARFRGAVCVVDEPLRLRQQMDAHQADFHQRAAAYLEEGRAFPLVLDMEYTAAEAFARLDRCPALLAAAELPSSANGFPDAETITVLGRTSERFRGEGEAIEAYVRLHAATGERLVLAIGQDIDGSLSGEAAAPSLRPLLEARAKLRELAAKRAWPCQILARDLRQGFAYPGASLIVLGTEDLLGRLDRPPRRREKGNTRDSLSVRFFSDLKVGDPVVHESNGIGIYEGIRSERDAEGKRRDYLTVRYAEGDRLYLPMDQLAQLRKYVGGDADKLRLSRLGGGEWERQKERARRSIRALATDLVALYTKRAMIRGHAFPEETAWDREFAEAFPYEETEDQLRCIQEVSQDMEQEKVMDRLLCGDVGFGKTEVAFRAMFKCVQDGFQAALVAPTTVLAQQHYENFIKRTERFPLRVGLLSRFVSPEQRRRTAAALRRGDIDVVIGTHRIFSRDVRFHKLGLLVIDEEQRFGVDQKEGLKALNPAVDVLSMSATPIPRTLHMSMSGIRDISVLEEAPEDRRPVQTFVTAYDPLVIREALIRELGRGGQVFYLYNDTRSIERKAAEIAAAVPDARILIAHGKLSEIQLEDVIEAFVKGEADILVCTTIIESGIDMPRVNTLIVENADRFGLSTLYQLRGRVGRSDRQAYAYITYQPEKVISETASKRLAAIRSFTDLGAGFTIALRDLEIRGAGSLLGAEQHGQMNAIGYDLYTRMLEEEIQRARQKEADQAAQEARPGGGTAVSGAQAEPPVRGDCSFDISLDAYIPTAFISDDRDRMEMYRRISRVEDRESYRDVLDEILDRFGDPGREILSLTDVAYVRSRAARCGIIRISKNKNSAIFHMDPERPADMRAIALLMDLGEYKGRLLFNAGSRPFIVFRGLGADPAIYPARLRALFMKLEQNMEIERAARPKGKS